MIDTDNADALPPVLSLDGESQDVMVLALPLLQANGGNCLKPMRWPSVRCAIGSAGGMSATFGDDTRQIAVMQPELTLRFAHQNNSDYLTCPLSPACSKDSQGAWHR
jgi:type VI secretion system protein ImpJ